MSLTSKIPTIGPANSMTYLLLKRIGSKSNKQLNKLKAENKRRETIEGVTNQTRSVAPGVL